MLVLGYHGKSWASALIWRETHPCSSGFWRRNIQDISGLKIFLMRTGDKPDLACQGPQSNIVNKVLAGGQESLKSSHVSLFPPKWAPLLRKHQDSCGGAN